MSKLRISMEKEGQGILTLRLSGIDADGIEISSENMSCSLIIKHLELVKKLVPDEQDLRIGIEHGSILTKLILPVLVCSSLASDYDKFAQGNYSDIEPKRLNAMMALDKRARNNNLNLSVQGEGRELYNSANAAAPDDSLTYESEESMEIAGTVLDAGGKGDKPNIHIENKNGKYKITATREQLKSISYNILYQEIRVLVTYKYNVLTGEQRDYRLQKLVELDCLTKEFCVTVARNEAKAWQDVNDINAWIQNVRGEE